MSYWTEKHSVVIGGSRGLGLALARALVAAGSETTIVARNAESLQQVCNELGPRARAQVCDVTNDRDVEAMVQQLRESTEKLNAVFCVAGRSARSAILDTTVDDFRSLMELNFYSAVRCTRLMAPWLAEADGHLVLIGSLASKSAAPFVGAYPASKFALAAYAQQLRLELSGSGLHVLHVCPGPIARTDAGHRYDETAVDLPARARQPGAGVRLNAIAPERLANVILRGCERRQPEIVIPAKARLLFAIGQLFPRFGDWILAKKMR